MYYKALCRKWSGELVSLNDTTIGNEFCLVYQEGKWVKPKIPHSQLFVFKTFQQAKDMLVYLGGCFEEETPEIWTCNIRGITPYDVAFRNAYKRISGTSLWEYITSQRKQFGVIPSDYVEFSGTVFCDKLKLIECVHRGEVK